jgi:hypothetical protein
LAHNLIAWGKIKLKPLAAQLLSPEMTSRAYFELLLEQDQLADARRILAHALPKRRALWWGTLCLQDALRPTETSETAELLRICNRRYRLPRWPQGGAALVRAVARQLGLS